MVPADRMRGNGHTLEVPSEHQKMLFYCDGVNTNTDAGCTEGL